MQLSFANKSVVVTGASRGIGLAIALGFARAGARVTICARGKEGLDAAAVEIARYAPKSHAAVCDLGDEASNTSFATDAAAALGGIDVLVNNASGTGKGDDEAAWSAGINVDLLGTVRATRTAVPCLERSGAGAVEALIEGVGAEEMVISAEIGDRALETAMRYGKAVGHAADLNFVDCFAYACAKARQMPLLYKGNDFAETDLA